MYKSNFLLLSHIILLFILGVQVPYFPYWTMKNRVCDLDCGEGQFSMRSQVHARENSGKYTFLAPLLWLQYPGVTINMPTSGGAKRGQGTAFLLEEVSFPLPIDN